MEPLQARVPEQRAPLRIGHVPDDRPVAVAARLRALDALVLLDHPKANPQHPHERRDGHIEIAHVAPLAPQALETGDFGIVEPIL